MLNGGNGGFSLADIAAAVRGSGEDGGFGGNGAWWVIIILIAMWGGFGNGGWGNREGSNSGSGGGGNSVTYIPYPMGGYGIGSYGGAFGFTDAAIQAGFNNQAVITKLDGINSGICSLGYDQLAQMNNINNSIMQTNFGLQQAINADTVANMQNTNALATQLANCCCENRQGQAQIQFNMSQIASDLQNTMNNNTRDMLEANCTNFRNLSDQIATGFNQLAMSQKDSRIADLEQQLMLCNMRGIANDAAQGAVNQVSPRAVPCYPGANPNGVGNWSQNVLSGNCTCGNF